MMEWLTVLPPLVAIIVVLWRKEVILALFLAVLTSETLLSLNAPLNGFVMTLERFVSVFSDSGNTRILLFSLLVGALLAYMRQSGGVSALVDLLVRRGMAKNRRQAGLLPAFTGVILFIETNLSILTAGIVARGLFDRFGMSRARLAYIIDSTSSPISVIILFNGWGAYILALLNNNGLEDGVSVMIGSVGLNFYALLTIAAVFYTVISDRVFGPMKDMDVKATEQSHSTPEFPASKARFMILPLLVMTGGIFAFMYWTGNGVLTAGNGSKSVLYATILASITAYLMMLASRRFSHIKLVDIGFKGMSELLPLVTIVLMAMALGASLRELGTGEFIAGLAGENLPPFLIVPMLFLAGGLMSFTTGTSWGTFALLIPIGVPMIHTLGLPPSLVLGAILGGGVFGDHCSPISDSTVVSSLAAGCSLLDHVKTQLPYALVVGTVSFGLYIIASLIMI